MSRTGIDYSKWDKMEFSDCDDDDNDASDSNQISSKPIVTRLDQPTRVTFGGKQKEVTTTTVAAPSTSAKKGYGVDYSKWDKMDYGDADDGDDDDCSGDEDDFGNPPYQGHSPPDRSPVTTKSNEVGSRGEAAGTETKGASFPRVTKDEDVNLALQPNETAAHIAITDANALDVKKLRLLTINGGTFRDPISNRDTYWSQDRYEVILSIVFDHSLLSTRDIRVCVTGAFSYKDRNSATASGGGDIAHSSSCSSASKGTLTVVSGDDIILKGDLPNFVYFPEGEEEVEWEMDISNNDPKKGLIRITLLKAVPMQGLTIWWRHPLLNFPEINVETDIEGRYKQNNVSSSSSGSKHDQQAASKIKETWDEAHRMFREKVKNREKQVVHV